MMYALWAVNSETYFSYGGKVLLHQDPAELAYLFPALRDQIRKVEFPLGRPWMYWRDHPQWKSKLEVLEEGKKQWQDLAQP